MDSEKNQGGRPSNEEVSGRRDKIKEMLLQGISIRDMANALGVSVNTVQADIIYWTDYFRQLGMNHPEVVRLQMAKVQEVLSEIDMVKRQYWSAYNKLLEEQKEQEDIKKKWRTEFDQMKMDYQTAVENKNREEMRRLAKLIKETARAPRLPSLHRAQLDNLKLIMDRIDKEAKLLNLFNPGANQVKMNTISLETLKAVMMVFKNIIIDLVPEDQRRYAFERLRRVKIEELKPSDITDAEIVEPKPAGLTRIDPPTDSPVPEKEGDNDTGLEDLDI
jgi:transposase